jgi:TPR repeat protein
MPFCIASLFCRLTHRILEVLAAALILALAAPALADDTAATLRRAQAGDAAAQAQIGYLYEMGQGGMPKDSAQAFAWYSKSAAQGGPYAETRVGWYHEAGVGGATKSDVEAAQWYKKAAEHGDSNGQSNLGDFYQNGQGGLPKDPVQAFAWYLKAANQGRASSENQVGMYHQNGWGGAHKSDPEAAQWYQKAADHGNVIGRNNLARLRGMYAGNQPQPGGEPAARGPQFCNNGISDGMGGCISYGTGQNIDPTTGKPLY